MAPPDTLSGLAPAKVNLVLEVTGRRADGYHEVDSVLQTLALADTVTLTVAAGEGCAVAVGGPFAAGTPTDASNLAVRAAVALANLVGESVDGLRITLDKQIPPAAGLGGGASDAATVLRLLQRTWPRVTEAHLRTAAETVGSDEAFFLTGGLARTQGRGERVTPLRALARRGVVLFVPPATIAAKTARMFAALSALPYDTASVAAAFAADGPVPFGAADVYNTFERVAFDVFPGLAALWEQLERCTREPIRLAGAGPTLFWIGDPSGRDHIGAATRGAPCTVIATETAPSLWRR